MKVKTAELEGVALDWAVAKAAFPRSVQSGDRLRVRTIIDGELCCIGSVWLGKPGSFTRTFEPSTDWSQGGPLIETHGIGVIFIGGLEGQNCWQVPTYSLQEAHQKPLVIAMRALVAAKLGAEVEIPDELAQ